MLSDRSQLSIWTAAILTAIVGIVNLLSAVTPGIPARINWLRGIFPFEVRAGAHLFAVMVAFMLLTLATSLLRRKRVAWLLTIALLVVSIISNLVKGFDYEEAILAGVLLVQLLLMRHNFNAQSDRPSLTRGIKILIVALLFVLAYGTLGFYLLDLQFNQKFNFWESFQQTLALFFTADNGGLEPRDRWDQFFVNSVEWMGILTLLYAFSMLLRPVLVRSPATSQQRRKATAIVQQYGRSSLARFTLLDDKSYYFSASGRSVIAYVAQGRGAIVLGDPIGALDDLREVIVGFQQFCARQDWIPAFYQVFPNNLELYKSLGFETLCIGEEAIVDLNTFTTKGKAGRNFRTGINRMIKEGYKLEFYEPPISDRLLYDLRLVSDEWLKMMHGSEKKFSLGWFNEDYLRNGEIAVVRSPEGDISAFANMVTEYQSNDTTIDLMRRKQESENGTMDFLFVSLFEHYKEQGYDGFNLGLSALAGVGETVEAPRLEKEINYLYQHFNKFYNFQGLHEYKNKFHPRWESRYFVYPRLADLPAVVLALVRADSGDRLWDYLKPGGG